MKNILNQIKNQISKMRRKAKPSDAPSATPTESNPSQNTNPTKTAINSSLSTTSSKTPYTLLAILLAVILGVGINYTIASFGPTSNPPDGNPVLPVISDIYKTDGRVHLYDENNPNINWQKKGDCEPVEGSLFNNCWYLKTDNALIMKNLSVGSYATHNISIKQMNNTAEVPVCINATGKIVPCVSGHESDPAGPAIPNAKVYYCHLNTGDWLPEIGVCDNENFPGRYIWGQQRVCTTATPEPEECSNGNPQPTAPASADCYGTYNGVWHCED